LNAFVPTVSLSFQSKKGCVKFIALLRIADTDCGVIDAKKDLPITGLPFNLALSFWKMNQFKVMIVRVMKIKSLDPFRLRNGFRKSLWHVRDVLHIKFSQMLIRFFHVTYHNRNVLKYEVVTLCILRNRTTTTCQIVSELNELVSQLHSNN